MSDVLERVAAIAERERAKDASTSEDMRTKHPGLPDRRNVVVPPIPGVSR